MLALVASACLFIVVGQLRAQFPHLRRVWALLLVLVAGASIAAPLALRGRARVPVLETRPIDATLEQATAEGPSRVTILAIDAGSLDLITGAAADGRLPNFGRVLDAGAVMHLATIHPTSAEAVWTAVATGKLPQKNGVRSAAVYDLARGGEPLQLLPDYCFAHALVRFGFVAEVPHTSGALRTRPFWSILTALGIPVGVVGWPLTQPAPAVRGYMVSEAYPRLAATPSAIDDSSSVYPPDMKAEVVRAFESIAADAPAVAVPGTVDERRPSRPDLRPDRQDARARAPDAGERRPVLEPRRDRALLPALCDAVRVWRRDRRRTTPVRIGARVALQFHRRGDWTCHRDAGAGRSPAGRVRLRHGAARIRQTAARGDDRRSGI